MTTFLFILEVIGTFAFAVSGALVGLRKNMDVFGICVLGLTTAVGGGMVRDLILGNIPPMMFRSPVYAMIAVTTSIGVFLPFIRSRLLKSNRTFDLVLLVMDTLGLGAFTVVGVEKAIVAEFEAGLFLTVFVGVLTGVGGGLLRDMMAGNTPYIFVKHIYACACIAGALACALLWDIAGSQGAMLIGLAIVMVIRFLAAHYRWNLPKPGVIPE